MADAKYSVVLCKDQRAQIWFVPSMALQSWPLNSLSLTGCSKFPPCPTSSMKRKRQASHTGKEGLGENDKFFLVVLTLVNVLVNVSSATE